MTTLKVTKVGKSQYGTYAQLEDGSYKGITDAVAAFIKEKVPCEIEVVESEGEGKKEKLTRVKVLGQTPTPTSGKQTDEFRMNVDAGNCVLRGSEMVQASKAQTLMEGTMQAVAAFKAAKKELNSEIEVEPNGQIETQKI